MTEDAAKRLAEAYCDAPDDVLTAIDRGRDEGRALLRRAAEALRDRLQAGTFTAHDLDLAERIAAARPMTENPTSTPDAEAVEYAPQGYIPASAHLLILEALTERRDEVERLRVFVDAAHGLICNAHQKRVDDVTNEDGASPGWAEAARRWIDAYPFGVLDAAPAETAPRRTTDCTCSGTENPPLPAWMDPSCPLHGVAGDATAESVTAS